MTRRDDTDVAITQITDSALDASESAYSYTTVSLMNRDWDTLCRDLRAADHVAVWAEQHAELTGAQGPQDVVDRITGFYRCGDWDSHDRVMSLLVDRARTNDFDSHLAWRIAVRVLMPKAVLMAKTQRQTGLLWDEVFATMLGALFEVVRTYPLHRRPRRIYNNIALDTLALAQRTLRAYRDQPDDVQKLAESVAPLAQAECHARYTHVISSADPDTPTARQVSPTC